MTEGGIACLSTIAHAAVELFVRSIARTSECLPMLRGQPAFCAKPNRAGVQSAPRIPVHAQMKNLYAMSGGKPSFVAVCISGRMTDQQSANPFSSLDQGDCV